MLVFDATNLHQYAEQIFRAAGADAENTEIVVDHLIDANLAGHDSHGVMLIPAYVRQIQNGALRPSARPSVITDRSVAALVDGAWTFGHVASRYATDLAVARAKAHGLALVGVVRCNHIGRLGDYAARAAAQGVVLVVTYGFLGPIVAPYGGRSGALVTNPFAIGFPSGDHTDFMLDFATSVVAGGKIQVAQAKNESIPAGMLIDKNGEPTTNPNDFYDGGVLLPFGGHKGYGLGVASVLFSQVLVGASDHADDGRGSGAFFLAIDGGVFRPLSAVESEADAAFANISAVPPAPGFDSVRIPGEPEAQTRERRLREGIPVPERTWQEIRESAETVGVQLPSSV